jgi:hypothetical protein
LIIIATVTCGCYFPSSRIVRTINSSRVSSVRPPGEVGEEEVHALLGSRGKWTSAQDPAYVGISGAAVECA